MLFSKGPNLTHPLHSARSKIKWAKTQIVELNSFLNSELGVYGIRAESDSTTNELVYYLDSISPIPDKVSLMIGDIVHNVRAALDHLAYAIVFKDTNGIGIPKPNRDPFRHVQFPIFDSSSEYESRKHGQIEGAKDTSIKAIDATKPYRGGNDVLWQLHRLNIIDKHRLALTVCTNQGGRADVAIDGSNPNEPLLFVSPNSRVALQKGDVLLREPQGSEPKKHHYFTFLIAFAEPQIIEGDFVIEVLNGMAQLVGNIISDFEGFF